MHLSALFLALLPLMTLTTAFSDLKKGIHNARQFQPCPSCLRSTWTQGPGKLEILSTWRLGLSNRADEMQNALLNRPLCLF